MNPSHPPLANSNALALAQLRELSQREIVSAAVAFPAILTVAWVHRSVVPLSNLIVWSGFLSLILLMRMFLARRALMPIVADSVILSRRKLRIALSVMYGIGWGAMMFLLDSGQLDFLFMFKFATVAAVLGITVNAFSVVLPVYLGFLVPVILMLALYLSTTAYVISEARLALLFGVAVYTTLLVVAALNVFRLTRQALKQGFEREAALAEATASQLREVELRQRLQEEAVKLEETNRSLHLANERLNDLARHDPLTGAFNRRHLIDELERHFQVRSRYGSGFSVILLDIDHFKTINDSFGHQAGDHVLISLTQQLEKDLRDIDIFGRWGGEEFLCILPNTEIPEAVYCAERLRASLESARLVEQLPELAVTASFGVGTCQPDETIDTLLQRVDALLYAAKAAGRNCIRG
jgi:diguanylate cyclase (GGDEF)-like protein